MAWELILKCQEPSRSAFKRNDRICPGLGGRLKSSPEHSKKRSSVFRQRRRRNLVLLHRLRIPSNSSNSIPNNSSPESQASRCSGPRRIYEPPRRGAVVWGVAQLPLNRDRRARLALRRLPLSKELTRQ